MTLRVKVNVRCDRGLELMKRRTREDGETSERYNFQQRGKFGEPRKRRARSQECYWIHGQSYQGSEICGAIPPTMRTRGAGTDLVGIIGEVKLPYWNQSETRDERDDDHLRGKSPTLTAKRLLKGSAEEPQFGFSSAELSQRHNSGTSLCRSHKLGINSSLR
jgi:hypothetical protein